jgi:SAM-dependent methyltransferase
MINQPSSCPICGRTANFKLIQSHQTGSVAYSLYQCFLCQVGHWQPFKNPGSDWYEQDERYSGINSQPFLDVKPGQKLLLNQLKPGKLFDIGCGSGNFLAYAKKLGWDVGGIDFDRNAIAAAQNVFGLSDVEVSDLEGYCRRHSNNKFDLVTFFDVFEHIDNHQEFIGYVRGLVTPGGRLAMTLPYGGAWRWLVPHDLPPRHLTRWTDVALKKYLEDRGWLVEKIVKEPATLEYLLMKIRFRYGRWFSFGLVKKISNQDKKNNPVKNQVVAGKKNKVSLAFLVARAARLKDWVLFGLPALALWVALWPSEKRYVGMFLVAKTIV